MPLRSDFNIRAVTPEITSIDATAGTIVAEQAGYGPASQLKELVEGEEHGPTMARQTAQQTPESIDSHNRPPHHPDLEALDKLQVQVRRVRLTSADDAPELSRAEVTLPSHKHGKSVEAHVYESYWAPFTEGQISFLETVRFLYSAAWNGIETYFLAWRREKGKKDEQNGQGSEITPTLVPESNGRLKHFDRWMFGKFQDMAITRHTFWLLFAVVLSVSFLLVPALLVFTPLGLSIGRWVVTGYTRGYMQWPISLQIGIAFLAVAIFAFAWAVHYFVVEYVGDVAIYVSSYKVSRFDAIRDKIRQEACSAARQIYSAGIADTAHPCYDSVVVVGHSLGSVISYDLLNSSINWDQIDCAFERKVVLRTTRLITFGSPLDKTAFLFRTQVSSARNLREALAARQQPLILDYQKFRPLRTFRWINIHAPADIISGQLDYYDASDKTNLAEVNPVINLVDPEATTPLLAHVQYWDNATLHQCLYEAAWAAVHAS